MNWISVHDALPDTRVFDQREVLICCGDRSYEGVYASDGRFYLDSGLFIAGPACKLDVTDLVHHWMYKNPATGIKDHSATGGCPICGSREVPIMHPRTYYTCGSSDYDGYGLIVKCSPIDDAAEVAYFRQFCRAYWVPQPNNRFMNVPEKMAVVFHPDWLV